MKKNTTKKLAAILSLAVVCAGAFGVASLNKVTADTAVNPDCFEMVEGASIRLASDKNGIRFITKFGSNVYQSIMTREAGTDVRVGAYIVPADYVDYQAAYESGAQIGEYDKLLYKKDACFFDSTDSSIENMLYQDGDYYYGNAALTNMLFENLGKDFVGIGYIAWTTDGVTTYEFIENEETVVRSAAYVASAHYGKETDATKVEVVDHYAYGSLFAKTGVVTYDAAAGQYTVYGTDTYSTVADVMDAINGSLELSVSETTLSVAYPETPALTANVQLKYASAAGGEATETASGVNFAIKCESSNPDAATYENGVVTSVAKGETTLTFSCMDLEATCEVNVRQRTVKNLNSVDFDLSKDTSTTIALGDGEEVTKVLVGETDITADVTATADSVSISKDVLENCTKGDNKVEIFTENYQYNTYVCVADYVLSDQTELTAFRTAAQKASDQNVEQTALNGSTTLTWSDTWDWYVVLDADIACTGWFQYTRVSYFGVLDGRGHALSNVQFAECKKWDRGGFFDNRIARGDEGVLDSNNVMHTGVGLRLRNLAIINFTAYIDSGIRGGFTGTTTKGSTYENIYYTGNTGLVDQYMNTGKNGSFHNIVANYSLTYFPMQQGDSFNWQNIEGATNIKTLNSKVPMQTVNDVSIPLPGCESFAGDATAFYNGVKTAITAEDGTWNKDVWSVADNGDITFGGNVIIEAPAA